MKRLSLLLMVGVIVGLLGPETVLALASLRNGDPCGKILCCCPDMCKRVKKGHHSCPMARTVDCGITQTAASSTLSAELSVPVHLALLGGKPLSNGRDGFSTLFPYTVHFDSLTRAPLEKPPAITT